MHPSSLATPAPADPEQQVRAYLTEHPEVPWDAAVAAIAKDGADLPPRLETMQKAALHIVSGEVYDFEFQPDEAGEMQFQVENSLNKAKSVGKVFVQ